MQKLLFAALATAALALPVSSAPAQARAETAATMRANIQLAQGGEHRRFRGDMGRGLRPFHRGAGPRRDWDRGFRDHRRFDRGGFRDHRRFDRDRFGGFDRRFRGRHFFNDCRFGGNCFRSRSRFGFGFSHGFGFGSGFGFGHGFGSGFGSGSGFSRGCRVLWWDGWSWRCAR